ncbi:MAG: Uma2 family endonuclease [Beijerinckiaceae bacterium]
MGAPSRNPYPITAEEFFAFTQSRPDGEKWELIEGEPILNATASYLHQTIVGNLICKLRLIQRERSVPWTAIPGIGVELSDTNVPVPDVLVRPRDTLLDWKCDDMIVAFEVLSPSTADLDLRWKRKVYAGLPSLQHYVVIAQDAVEVVAYDRKSGFAERRLEHIGAGLDLPVLSVSVPLAEIYLDTGLDKV